VYPQLFSSCRTSYIFKTVGTFYFPYFAEYTPITTKNKSKALSPVDFPNWILSQFATIDEVRQSIEEKCAIIVPTVIDNWGDEPPPFHYVVYDKSGESIVIEPIEGKLTVHDNPLGVLTNSPNFDWHMTNYYKTYDDQTIRVVHMGNFNKNGKGIKLLSTKSKQTIIDMTDKLELNYFTSNN
jgi:choloylglycine hydrolase